MEVTLLPPEKPTHVFEKDAGNLGFYGWRSSSAVVIGFISDGDLSLHGWEPRDVLEIDPNIALRVADVKFTFTTESREMIAEMWKHLPRVTSLTIRSIPDIDLVLHAMPEQLRGNIKLLGLIFDQTAGREKLMKLTLGLLPTLAHLQGLTIDFDHSRLPKGLMQGVSNCRQLSALCLYRFQWGLATQDKARAFFAPLFIDSHRKPKHTKALFTLELRPTSSRDPNDVSALPAWPAHVYEALEIIWTQSAPARLWVSDRCPRWLPLLVFSLSLSPSHSLTPTHANTNTETMIYRERCGVFTV
jgi:hypothetical protein